MQVKLVQTKVASLSLTDDPLEAGQDNFQLTYSAGNSSDNSRVFFVKFNAIVISEQRFKAEVEYIAVFETDTDITEEFHNSQFPLINAPAIAYPFLRSFIATLSVNAGYDSVLIPVINFQALAAQRKGEQDEVQK